MQKNMSGSLGGVIDDMLSGSVAGNIQFESSGGSTVTITPTLESGTKIADFTIDQESGVLYAPTPEPPIEYTAGANIQISEENVISATDTTYTAGANIQISENNVISASGGGVNYSTEEQVVGTWIDGKPLYRKTVIKSGTISQRETISLGIANVENIFLVSDASNLNNGETPLPLITGTDNNNNTGGFFDIQQSDTSFLFRIGSGMVGNVENAIITVQYTKTTD